MRQAVERPPCAAPEVLNSVFVVTITVYFADKALHFLGAASDFPGCTVVPEPVSRDKILKILETDNSAAVVSADPEAAFAAFAAEFTLVEAAGGVVVNGCGEALMMRRNGRWDLPKGHVEPGENFAECAAREIAEETGIRAEVVRPLCATWHAYWFPKTARWELKRTHWYLLRGGEGTPKPQTEEGVEQVAWCPPAATAAHAAEAFPTVQRVIACLRETVAEQAPRE